MLIGGDSEELKVMAQARAKYLPPYLKTPKTHGKSLFPEEDYPVPSWWETWSL
jgi:hypothetical protein